MESRLYAQVARRTKLSVDELRDISIEGDTMAWWATPDKRARSGLNAEKRRELLEEQRELMAYHRKKSQPAGNNADLEEASTPEAAEERASSSLAQAKALEPQGKRAQAREWYGRIIKELPDTQAAKAARERLEATGSPPK